MHNGHIGSEQLDRLSRQANGSGELWSHIENCVQCRTTIAKYRKLNAKLDQLAANGVRSTSIMNCPDESIWLEVAAGTLPSEESMSYSSHAATCDACAKKLQVAIRISAPEITEEEKLILDSLPSFQREASVTPAKEETVVAKPVKPDEEKKASRRSFWRPLSYSFASLAVLIVIGFLSLGLITDDLLARGYTQKGTLEYRIAKASPPKEGTRRAGIAESEQPFSLVLAELLIRTRLALNSSSSRWLGEKGRFELIEGNLAAIETLEKAHSADPKSENVAIDLASAYCMRGKPDDLLHAEDLLLTVLVQSSTNSVALYNLALTFELLKRSDKAIEQWNHYLDLDSNSSWADEVRRRLAALQKLTENHKNRFSVQTSVDQWLSYLESDLPNADEAALEPALAVWLPRASDGNTERQYIDAIKKLAQKLHRKHGDIWLEEILKGLDARQFSTALGALNRAFESMNKDEIGDATAAAKEAEGLFREIGNLAGVARSQLEQVYAYQRSAEGDLCLETANKLRKTTFSKDFQWIIIQLDLDEASCFNLLGRMGEAELDAEDATHRAKESDYKILSLRAKGITASLATSRRETSIALENDISGLQEYWTNDYPVERAFQFYSDITFNSENRHYWQAAEEAAKTSVLAISRTRHKLLGLINRYHRAKALTMLQEFVDAEEEVTQANLDFASLKSTETAVRAQVDGAIALIRAELDSNRDTDAKDHLALLEKNIPSVKSHLTLSRLDEVKGEIEFRRGNLLAADKAYTSAVSMAELDLQRLNDPNKRALWSKAHIDSYKALAGTRLLEHDVTGAAEIWEIYKAAPIREHKSIYNSSSLASSSSMRVALPAKTVMVSYVFIGNQIITWVWADDGGQPRVFEHPINNLRRQIQHFVDECGSPSSDLTSLQLDAKELYDILIAPFADLLNTTDTLIIATDAELNGLSFGALINPLHKYLIEEVTILYSPGIYYWDHLRPPISHQLSDNVIVVTNPSLSRPAKLLFRPLPSSRAEAEMIASIFRHSRILQNDDATYKRLIDALPKADIFHFSSHSVNTYEGISLLLAPNEESQSDRVDLLRVSDIPSNNLHKLNLVVLSACSTGLRTSNNSQNLADAFLYSGVPQVIVTQWDINSPSAFDFMNRFYQILATKKNAATALQNASVAVLRNPSTMHPYHWAAFMISGRP